MTLTVALPLFSLLEGGGEEPRSPSPPVCLAASRKAGCSGETCRASERGRSAYRMGRRDALLRRLKRQAGPVYSISRASPPLLPYLSSLPPPICTYTSYSAPLPVPLCYHARTHESVPHISRREGVLLRALVCGRLPCCSIPTSGKNRQRGREGHRGKQ